MSAAKQKGTAAETAVVTYLQRRGWPNAERRALRGIHDAGDISGIPGVLIEVKSQRQMALAAWMNEVAVEQANCNADIGVCWHKRVGKGSPKDWYVTMTGEQFVWLLRESRW